MRNYLYILVAFTVGLLPAVAEAVTSDAVRSDYVEVQLVSEVESVQPGQPFTVGFRIAHDPHWHTYWKNPGDSGLETMLDWTLPEGFEAGEIQWPYPERLVMEPLVTFGYERDVLLLIEITPPGDLEPGQEITLALRADWLECKEICLPGDANVSLTLPVLDATPKGSDDWAEHFARARAALPLEESGWSFSAAMDDTHIQVQVWPPAEHDGIVESAEFFIAEGEIVEYLPGQEWTHHADDRYYTFRLHRNATFGVEPQQVRGVLVNETGWRGPDSERALALTVDLAAGSLPELAVDEGVVPVPLDVQELGLFMALIYAFLGGLILNLMPCVFPVISIKIMGFVHQAEQEATDVWKHGLVFTLGVLVSFWILAGLLIALRATGEQLGWGFQLQSPPFLFAMIALFFVFGLNLFGVFEVGTSVMGLGQKASSSSSWSGSFFSGALATLVATPCTAPLMGAALGYALMQLTPMESLMVFTFLGLGMASPYLLLSAYPQWLQYLPRPGAWMETLKQFMGWLLIAVVVWLAWVLNALVGGDGVILVLGAMFLLGVGCWIFGRWGSIARDFPVRTAAKVVALILFGIGLASGFSGMAMLAPVAQLDAEGNEIAAQVATTGMPWENFTPERFQALRDEGKPVFVNFTAAWCLSCQVNERVAFSSARVQARFAELGITPLKADWTARDDVIAGVLAEYDRSSVPFYVLYGNSVDAKPVTLPEILRPGTILNALDRLVEQGEL